MMISLAIRNYVDQIVSAYKESHVEYFFASSVIDDLRHNGINYNGIERDVVILLQSMVDQGILDRRYVIFSPENPVEKKVFKDIPVNSNESPLVKTFFVFAKK